MKFRENYWEIFPVSGTISFKSYINIPLIIQRYKNGQKVIIFIEKREPEIIYYYLDKHTEMEKRIIQAMNPSHSSPNSLPVYTIDGKLSL
jgi:hypothetical protein